MKIKTASALLFLSVFCFVNSSFAETLEDLNQDGKKDFKVDFYTRDLILSEMGETYKHAEFDTNFDGKMDIIIEFKHRFGYLERDSDFDGKLETKCGLLHLRPMSVESVSWLGRLDTWYVIGLSGVKTLLDYLVESYSTAEKNFMSSIKKGLEKGIDINAKDAKDETLLMSVVQSGYLQAAKFLTANGADVNAGNNDGKSALMLAINGGCPAMVKSTILQTNAPGNCDLEILKLLIQKGADINQKSKDGSTALIQAVHAGYFQTTKLLISSGAKVNSKNNLGLTALMEAVKRNYDSPAYLPFIQLLIENNADVNAGDINGMTVLMLAMQQDYGVGALDAAKLLVDNGADINAKLKDGSTVLMQMVKRAKFGYADVIEMLIEKGADITVKDNKGMTVLMRALQSGLSEIPALLIKKGADIEAKDDEGLTALIQRSREHDFQMVWFLIQMGANINARDTNGDTILMQFISGGFADQAESLLKEDIDVNAKNNDGMTALMYAVEQGNLRLVSTLLASGADIDIKDNAGRNVVDIAQKQGNDEMISLLKQYTERSLRPYKNEKYGFEIKVFTEAEPLVHDWEQGRSRDMPLRLWDASFFDRSFGVLHSRGQVAEIPVINITVNVCFQNLELCLQNACSDCEKIPYGNLMTVYGPRSLEITQDEFHGIDVKRLKISCFKDAVYEGIALVHGNRLYTILFLTAIEGGKAFPPDLVDAMLASLTFADENIPVK